jgi:hypothetical protein
MTQSRRSVIAAYTESMAVGGKVPRLTFEQDLLHFVIDERSAARILFLLMTSAPKFLASVRDWF